MVQLSYKNQHMSKRPESKKKMQKCLINLIKIDISLPYTSVPFGFDFCNPVCLRKKPLVENVVDASCSWSVLGRKVDDVGRAKDTALVEGTVPDCLGHVHWASSNLPRPFARL